MVVCICHRVSDSEIKELKESGVLELSKLQECCKAGKSCGMCVKEICSILQSPKTDSVDCQKKKAKS